jgi:hypothetical protein
MYWETTMTFDPTPPQLQREYIITEEQIDYIEKNSVCLPELYDEIRSHPHTTAPDIVWRCCEFLPRSMDRKPEDCEMVKQASRTATLATLDMLLEYGASDNCPVCPCPRNKDKSHDPWGCVKCIVESLRTTTGDDQR